MDIQHVSSQDELIRTLKNSERSYLLIYKQGSEQSDCAFKQYKNAAKDIKDIKILAADVSVVRDIHMNYNVTTAPTMLEFEKTNQTNMIKGCHDSAYFKAILEDALYRAETEKEGKTQKRVTVYSTPTCTWCNTLKNYLRQNKVRYTDIDVSINQSAAQEMVNRSGRQGVPQTEINGTMIIGFDKKRINELLEIKG